MCGVCVHLYRGTAGFVLAVHVLIPDSCPFSNFRQLIALLSFVKEWQPYLALNIKWSNGEGERQSGLRLSKALLALELSEILNYR